MHAGLVMLLCACAAGQPGSSPGLAELPEATLSGQQLFLSCVSCHSLEPGEPHRVGPNLHGIMGQPAASRAGYTYSPALQASGLVWTETALAGFIMDSGRMVPDTWMVYHSHLSPEEAWRLAAWIGQAGASDKEGQ
jgi:cytochrome c